MTERNSLLLHSTDYLYQRIAGTSKCDYSGWIFY